MFEEIKKNKKFELVFEVIIVKNIYSYEYLNII